MKFWAKAGFPSLDQVHVKVTWSCVSLSCRLLPLRVTWEVTFTRYCRLEVDDVPAELMVKVT